VLNVWKEMKRIDPSRLVEDNSPNKHDHVETDLNSWHMYPPDYETGRRVTMEVIEKTTPGSEFNYVPGRKQGTAPLINSEYGAVGSGGGDRDVSWGFRFLTTELRRHEKVQGYIYTELSDIEWEHNGFYNYDRTRKDFGYDAFVPGMTVADLQGEDFVGYDSPPALHTGTGGEVTIPLFVSHYSKLTQASLRWWLTGFDDLGNKVETEAQTRPVEWKSYRVTTQTPLVMRIPGVRPFTGAIALELVDGRGKRIAANFVNVEARTSPGPKVEVLGLRLVAIRFAPQDVATMAAGEPEVHQGKVSAAREVALEYRVTLPDFVRQAEPASVELLAELATRAGDAKVDWPSRQKPVDYPQTEERKFPGSVRVRIGDSPVSEVSVPDDPADARGFLSSLARYHYASYGYLTRVTAPAPAADFKLRLEGEHGIALYGEGMGRYGFNPAILVKTSHDVSRPVGWKED
jgi:hypothetical protein